MKRAFTLAEIMVVISLTLFMAAIVFPTYSKQMERARFEVFASELTGHLLLARRSAQLLGVSVHLDFTQQEQWRYRCLVAEEDDQWRELARSTATGKTAVFANQLPNFTLPHPTQSRDIDSPLSSLHAPEVIFTPHGSSSATVVFSDGNDHVICAVVSGRTGRFRVYTWNAHLKDWRVYF